MARLRGALANNTVFIVLNRRMRIRTYGGVRGVELLPAYSILLQEAEFNLQDPPSLPVFSGSILYFRPHM